MNGEFLSSVIPILLIITSYPIFTCVDPDCIRNTDTEPQIVDKNKQTFVLAKHKKMCPPLVIILLLETVTVVSCTRVHVWCGLKRRLLSSSFHTFFPHTTHYSGGAGLETN